MVKDMLTMRRGNNTVQGTPAYMAPEMITTPDKVDFRADIYSLGVTAFQMVTGRLPFQAPQPIQVLMMHCTQAAPNPKQFRAELSPKLEKLIMGMLEKQPDKRITTPEAIAELLA
jgi:serine/threonine-protein kinase